MSFNAIVHWHTPVGSVAYATDRSRSKNDEWLTAQSLSRTFATYFLASPLLSARWSAWQLRS
jgi:hypothetical protein